MTPAPSQGSPLAGRAPRPEGPRSPTAARSRSASAARCARWASARSRSTRRSDRDALHVFAADETAPPRPRSGVAELPDVDKILAAARRTGADAIHPGYGFLSEIGLVRGGGRGRRARPSSGRPDAIARHGRQDPRPRARDPLGVPVLAGTDGTDRRSRASCAATRVGYPVMLKAARAGAARGCAVLNRPDEFEHATGEARRARRGTRSATTVYLEQFIESRATSRSRSRRRARQRRPPRRARVLDPAPPPEGRRGGAVAAASRGHAAGDGRAGRRLAARSATRTRARSSSSSARPGLLLPRDEHAAPGRASGDRDGHRPRPGRADDPRRRRRAAAAHAGRDPASGYAIEARLYAEDPTALPALDRAAGPATGRRRSAGRSASTPASSRAAKCRCTTTR